MKLYKYDSDNLVYIRTNKLLKYRFIVGILVLSVFLLSFVTAKTKIEIAEKENIIKQKENRIKEITTPLREDVYIEDLIQAIGHNFTEKEKLQVEDLALTYKEKLEKAKIPMSLMIWIAYKESRFDHKAQNTESTAKGLFQFVDGTWEEMCKLKGVSTEGRFNKDKQVDILITYLNYLYSKHADLYKVM
jgi:hypothetical protein